MRQVAITRGNRFHGSQLKNFRTNLPTWWPLSITYYCSFLRVIHYQQLPLPPTECLSWEFSCFCCVMDEDSVLLGYYATPLGVSKRRGSIAQWRDILSQRNAILGILLGGRSVPELQKQVLYSCCVHATRFSNYDVANVFVKASRPRLL
jgi:hypothetical protein